MKIVFSTVSSYSIANLIQFSGTENVGYEDDFSSCATLSVKEDGKDKLYVRGKLQNYAHRTPLVGDNPRWETAWSSFSYCLTGHKDSRDQWEYYGAENGFLKQNLLMPLPGVQIISVEGTYGSFKGLKALEEYSNLKDAWYEKMFPIYQSLEDQRLIPPDNGHGASRWCAEQWNFAHRQGVFKGIFRCNEEWKFDSTPWEGPKVKEVDSKRVTINDPDYMIVVLDWGGYKPDLSPYNLAEAGLVPIYDNKGGEDFRAHWFKVRRGTPIKVGDLLPKW